MPHDSEKAKARKRRYLDRIKVAKYGPSSTNVDMRGRHGNHARGPRNARWKCGRFVTSHGYVAVRVPSDHPHAWGADDKVRYAYEHILIAEEKLGRSLLQNEIVHHDNGIKTDNRWGDNLKVITRTEHAKEHDARRGRDSLGRFPPADPRIREFPR